MLDILYHDEALIAINKPHGLLVHRSSMAANAHEYAVQILRDQIGQFVYPAHRLDRKTSGALLFALTKEDLRSIRTQFDEQLIDKTYWAILRGWSPESGMIDYALTNDKGKLQEAKTAFKTLQQTEIELPFGRHNTSRYSWVEARPQTGRMHQLRKHFAHIMHPIIGDRPYGCNKQNKLFLAQWKMEKMLLHAQQIRFKHPRNHQKITIKAHPHSVFLEMLQTLHFETSDL